MSLLLLFTEENPEMCLQFRREQPFDINSLSFSFILRSKSFEEFKIYSPAAPYLPKIDDTERLFYDLQYRQRIEDIYDSYLK